MAGLGGAIYTMLTATLLGKGGTSLVKIVLTAPTDMGRYHNEKKCSSNTLFCKPRLFPNLSTFREHPITGSDNVPPGQKVGGGTCHSLAGAPLVPIPMHPHGS